MNTQDPRRTDDDWPAYRRKRETQKARERAHGPSQDGKRDTRVGRKQ